jgi:hypothetical protein
MRFQSTPTDENAQPFDAGVVFETCVSMVKNQALKAKLQGVRPDVETAAADYDAKAATSQLFKSPSHNAVGGVSCAEMVQVYTGRMVPKNSTGRPTYNRIMALPVNQRCPLCGIGTVNTLDHYLPKTHFPVFSVTPNNLIPACTWCQGEKLEYFATTKGEQLLHPYFDNFDGEEWLVAQVVEDSPAAFRFYSLPPLHWSAANKARVATHLKELNLPVLFSSNAGSRLSEIRSRLVSLLQKGGEVAVRAHLLEELASIEADHKNSWATAMYRAATKSDWFCQGGFDAA